MNMTAKQLVEWGIANGYCRRMGVNCEKHDRTATHRNYMRNRRAEWKAAGLTIKGTVPKRASHPELKGLSMRDYKREFARKKRKERSEKLIN